MVKILTATSSSYYSWHIKKAYKIKMLLQVHLCRILRSNNISEIQYPNFKSFPALQHLDLSDNKISVIPEMCFSTLAKLVSL